MARESRTFTVELNLQQYQVLEEVRREGTLGATDGEILRRAFLTWVRKREKERARRSQRRK